MTAPHCTHLAAIFLVVASAASPRVTAWDTAEESIERFLAQDDAQPSYRATRHLEAENGSRKGWLDAVTEYSPGTGFRYQIVAEGGSTQIRNSVLKAVLDGERAAVARGELAKSALDSSNYTFQANGLDRDGLAIVLLSPRRKERVLVAGTMALNTTDGALVRLQGRLAKSPSFWVRNVDIVRTYQRIDGKVVPVALTSKAQVRFMGEGTLRMTYAYSEIEGRQLTAEQ